MKRKQIPSLDLYILNQLYYINRHINHRLSFSFCKARESSVLLQQRHQEVYGHMDVLEKLLLTNLYVTHGGAEAEDLLHLKFDGGLALDVLF